MAQIEIYRAEGVVVAWDPDMIRPLSESVRKRVALHERNHLEYVRDSLTQAEYRKASKLIDQLEVGTWPQEPTADLRFQQDEELSGLVATYVIARDEAGEDPDRGDFTEGGFTDFDYVADDLQPAEFLQVGMNIARSAAGRDVWYAHDGVGFRIFFGPLEEVKERVRKLIVALEVLTT